MSKISTETALQSGWTAGDDSDDQKTAVSSPPSPMSLATLVTPGSHRTSWFNPTGSVLTKPRPFTAPDFRTRRASALPSPRVGENSRETANGKESVESSADGASTTGYEADVASHHAGSPIPPKEINSRSPYALPRSVSSPIPKKRGSLLVAATDVLSFKFGRRRKSIRQMPMPIILPDVIEISASRRDDEVEERERLRDAAAQSIGLDPILMSTEDPVKEVDETETSINEYQELDSARTQDNFATDERYTSEISDTMYQPFNGSIRLPKTSIVTSVPDFPSTIAILADFTQSSANLIKYYPPTSLRLFALSKNWKNRFLVLSSSLPRSSQGANTSFLHLFRSSNSEEKELERLEINEDSVVFVAEEDVGGRKNVVKVGGVNVGVSKEPVHTKGNSMMWFLQISDPPEAQRWITLIKSIILGLRSMRAGLGIPDDTQGGIEPRGDMDVMLSMHAQGIVTSLTVGSLKQSNFNSSRSMPTNVSHPFATPDQNCAASISSQSSRSQAPSPKPQALSVSTLKGLFSGVTRPRSPSQSVSIDEGSERETNEDSFGNVGNNLLNMTRSNGTPDIPPSPMQALKQPYHVPNYKVTGLYSEQRLDRRIVIEQPGGSWPIRELPTRPSRAVSVGSLSLQPAPRRRPWTIGSQALAAQQYVAQNEGHEKDSSAKDEPSSPGLPSDSSISGFPFGSPEDKARAPSLRSISTFASGDNGSNMDRSSSSTKMKRWSRQGLLPTRLTPPSGPPPAIPQSQSPRSHNSNYPYQSEGGANCQSASSIPSATSQVSVVSGLPTFSKRGSNSSGFSANSGNVHIGHSVTRTGGSRGTVPPPRPAPTFAPPPAPDHDNVTPRQTDTTFAPRSPTFRDPFPRRSFRLSLTSPKPPPSTTLPPRPDEPEYHARTSSGSSNTHSTDLYPIPASPIPPTSPLPPPTHPLPPTPSSSSTTTPVTRNTSLKQRLRILSAPSSSAIPSVPEGDSSLSVSPRHPLKRIYQSPTQVYTPPTTPIGEQITRFQDDPSFLQMQTPITPELRTVRRLPLLPDQNVTFPEITSLSPPPRRGSRRLPFIEKEDSPQSNNIEVKSSVTPSDDKVLSLSRHGSVISLGIVSM